MIVQPLLVFAVLSECQYVSERHHQLDILESPLAQRRVQLTLAFILSIIFAAMYWGRSDRPRVQVPQHNDLLSIDETTLLRIDINTASFREFALLPGVGPILAKRIVEDRNRFGAFQSVNDLQRVNGIGPKTIDQISAICEVRSVSNSLVSAEAVAP